MQIIIAPSGDARCICDETLHLAALGHIAIERASHVEPNHDGCWLADLGPVRGPILGPFRLRSEALEAEQRWLECYWLTRSEPQV